MAKPEPKTSKDKDEDKTKAQRVPAYIERLVRIDNEPGPQRQESDEAHQTGLLLEMLYFNGFLEHEVKGLKRGVSSIGPSIVKLVDVSLAETHSNLTPSQRYLLMERMDAWEKGYHTGLRNKRVASQVGAGSGKKRGAVQGEESESFFGALKTLCQSIHSYNARDVKKWAQPKNMEDAGLMGFLYDDANKTLTWGEITRTWGYVKNKLVEFRKEASPQREDSPAKS